MKGLLGKELDINNQGTFDKVPLRYRVIKCRLLSKYVKEKQSYLQHLRHNNCTSTVICLIMKSTHGKDIPYDTQWDCGGKVRTVHGPVQQTVSLLFSSKELQVHILRWHHVQILKSGNHVTICLYRYAWWNIHFMRLTFILFPTICMPFSIQVHVFISVQAHAFYSSVHLLCLTKLKTNSVADVYKYSILHQDYRLIYLHLFTYCFMKISLQSLEWIQIQILHMYTYNPVSWHII